MAQRGLAIVPVDRDDPGIEAVLASVDAEHRRLDRWISHADSIYCAVLEGRAWGIGARFHSAIHPIRDWVSVHVEPSARRQGIGSGLLEMLTAQGGAPTKVRIPSGEEAGLRFAAAHGYSHLISSAEVALHHLPAPPPARDDEILGVPVDDDDFLDALGRLYVASHRWDPCAGLDAEQVRRFLAGEDVIPDTARVVRRRGEIVGVGVAYAGSTPDRVEMANFGAVDPEAPDGAEIAHLVLNAVARRLLDAGAMVPVECDFGLGANTALSALLVRLVGRPAATVEVLASA